jgi:hypothetical protein
MDICQILVGLGADMNLVLDASSQASRKFAGATPKKLAEAARHVDTAAFFDRVEGGEVSTYDSHTEEQTMPASSAAENPIFQKIANLKHLSSPGGLNNATSYTLKKRAAEGHARAKINVIICLFFPHFCFFFCF